MRRLPFAVEKTGPLGFNRKNRFVKTKLAVEKLLSSKTGNSAGEFISRKNCREQPPAIKGARALASVEGWAAPGGTPRFFFNIGETGTGKGSDPRAPSTNLKVRAAKVLSSKLMGAAISQVGCWKANLCGHERGHCTGATRGRKFALTNSPIGHYFS